MTGVRNTLRRKVRFLRTPLGLAAVLYAAGMIALAWWLPHRPTFEIPCQVDHLLGFSIDGQRFAAIRYGQGSGLTETFVWDFAQPKLHESTIDIGDLYGLGYQA